MVDAAPPNLESLMVDAAAARERGDTSALVRLYREAVHAFPDNKSLVIRVADDLRALGRWSEAIAILKMALAHTTESPAILSRIGSAYIAVSNYEVAVSYFQRIVDRDHTLGRPWVDLGQAQAAAGNWSDAAVSYGRALALMPLDLDAALGLGDTLYESGRADEALIIYRRVIAAFPDSADALFKLGSALLAVGEHTEAEDLLQRAVALQPGNASAHVNLAATLHYRGDLLGAVAACQRSLELNPNLPVTHYTLGLALADLGQTAEAAVSLKKATELDPKSIKGFLAVAGALGQIGDIAGADMALHQILRLEPGNSEARHLLAALHGEPVTTVPEGYTEKLFDWFAGRFDKHLVGTLGYRTPQDVTAMLKEVRPAEDAFKRLLDLGCGTGLVAAALAGHFRIPEKIGVDTSLKMLDLAKDKKLYEQLIHGDAETALKELGGTFDLVTAIDMLLYVGDLKQLIVSLSSRLAAGGLFAYSLETIPEGTFKLMPHGRFAHSVAYVEGLGRDAGLTRLISKAVTLRTEKGKPVAGAIGVLQRPA
jgi:predicted TPR repeat methyltransferase